MTSETVMMGQYDYRLVVLSIAVSILAAFAVRALAERIKARGGRTANVLIAPLGETAGYISHEEVR